MTAPPASPADRPAPDGPRPDRPAPGQGQGQGRDQGQGRGQRDGRLLDRADTGPSGSSRRLGGRWRRASRRPWLTVAGVATALGALAPPTHRLADDLLLAHMGQHLALAVVCPLLLALGAPALPPARTRTVALATVAHVGSLALWHVPSLYDAALRHTGLHLLEHTTLLAGGLLFWPVVLTARSGLAALFTAGLGSGALAALLTLSPRPLYGAHLDTAARHGLSALGDQQLAGAVMWVPGGILYAAVAIALLLRWLGRTPGPLRLPPGAVSGTLVVLALVAVATGCGAAAAQRNPVVPYGDPQQGADRLQAYGCGSCHQIPGVARANGLVGPPLDHFGRRAYIAGALPNTPDNLVRWITNPQGVEPGTAMPDLGVSQADAQDMVAYLESLN